MPYRLDIAGWMSESDLKAIEWMASQVPSNGIVLEIGSFLGRSTWAWCKSVPPGTQVIAIDSFSWLPEFGEGFMVGEPYDQSAGAEISICLKISSFRSMFSVAASTTSSAVFTPSGISERIWILASVAFF